MTAEWFEQLQSVLPETAPPSPLLSLGDVSASPSSPEPPPQIPAVTASESDASPSCFAGEREGDADEASTSVVPDGVGNNVVSSASGLVEGAGVILERALPMGSILPKAAPPLPREDPDPEPVTRRGGGYRDAGGKFRRNPAVSEALDGLSYPSEAEASAAELRRVRGKASGNAMRLASESRQNQFTPQQRLLLLDTWTRSGLPAADFGVLVGVSKHTLYIWKKRFEDSGPAGLEDRPRGGPVGSRMPEVTRRAILMLKQAHPEYGCERISELLARGPAIPASAGAVSKVLREAGYESVEQPTRRHPDKVRRFERESPNSLWQTDLFTFVLKRQNRRLHLVAFMDDHSRFIVGWGLFSSPSTEMVVETLKSAVASFQAPAELLTDNGPQYVTWRGKSKFSDVCVSLGIRQIVARPRRPQTLGKVERFWGTLWREFLGTAIFKDVSDARARIGKFVDYYNFQRPHQSLGGLSPADRYFGRSDEVKEALRRRLDENAVLLGRKMDEMDALPLTPDGSPETSAVVDEVPGPGFDALTAGLSAAAEAGGKEVEHEDAP